MLANPFIHHLFSGQSGDKFRAFSGQFLPKEMFEVVNDNNLDFFSICFKIFDSSTDNFIVSFIVSFIMSFDTLPDFP